MRQISADFIKGIAIILMVYGHITHIGSATSYQNAAVGCIYSFHMPLFLLISGFFFRLKEDRKASSVQVFSRLARPYLIFISLYLAGLWLVSKIGIPTSNSPPTSAVDFLNIVFLHPKGGYWFLHSLLLIQLCLLLPGIVRFIRNSGIITELGCSILLLAVLAYCKILQPKTATYFLIGFFLSSVTKQLKGSLIIGSVGIATTIFLFQKNVWLFSFSQVAWSLSILLLLVALADLAPKSAAVVFFSWIGRNSLSILVFHALFIVGLKPVAKYILKLEPSGILNSAVNLVVCLIGCLIAAVVLDRLRLSKSMFGSPKVYLPLRETTEKG